MVKIDPQLFGSFAPPINVLDKDETIESASNRVKEETRLLKILEQEAKNKEKKEKLAPLFASMTPPLGSSDAEQFTSPMMETPNFNQFGSEPFDSTAISNSSAQIGEQYGIGDMVAERDARRLQGTVAGLPRGIDPRTIPRNPISSSFETPSSQQPVPQPAASGTRKDVEKMFESVDQNTMLETTPHTESIFESMAGGTGAFLDFILSGGQSNALATEGEGHEGDIERAFKSGMNPFNPETGGPGDGYRFLAHAMKGFVPPLAMAMIGSSNAQKGEWKDQRNRERELEDQATQFGQVKKLEEIKNRYRISEREDERKWLTKQAEQKFAEQIDLKALQLEFDTAKEERDFQRWFVKKTVEHGFDMEKADARATRDMLMAVLNHTVPSFVNDRRYDKGVFETLTNKGLAQIAQGADRLSEGNRLTPENFDNLFNKTVKQDEERNRLANEKRVLSEGLATDTGKKFEGKRIFKDPKTGRLFYFEGDEPIEFKA